MISRSILGWCILCTILQNISCGSKDVGHLGFDKISITPIQSHFTAHTSIFWQAFQNESQLYLVTYNQSIHSIDVYDTAQQILQLKLKSTLENPVGGMLALNFDSIFIFERSGSKILLLDTSGIIKDRYELPSALKEHNTLSSFGIRNNLIWDASKQSLLVGIFNRDNTPFFELFKHPIVAKIHKDSNLSEPINMRYPPNLFNESGWWHLIGLDFSLIPDQNNKHLLSFATSNYCYIYEQGMLKDSILIQSKYLKNYDFPYFNESSRADNSYKRMFAAELGYYEHLFRIGYESYLRISKHPQKFRNKDNTVNDNQDAKRSMLLYSRGKTQEFVIEPKTFEFTHAFVHQDNFYVGAYAQNDASNFITFYKLRTP